MQRGSDLTRPGWLWLAAVALTLTVVTDLSSAYSNFCDYPANMEICYPEVSKRFLRFGRALTDDHFLRFGRNMDKRFLRFGRSDGEASLDDMLRLAIARAEAEEAPVYIRKRRSAPEAPQEASKAVAASSDHPEGVAKREAVNSDLPMEEEKRFMRFGRSSDDSDDMEEDKRFMRFGKRFMRFGRGDEENEEPMEEDKRFMRFGKRFMRFGRGDEDEDNSLSEDKRFMRFGKRFMRFGRNFENGQESGSYDDEDAKDKRFMRFGKRFMRFGRNGPIEEDLSADKRFMRFGKRFMRFGRDPMDAEKRFMRFGRSGQDTEDAKAEDKRFMRFGKRFMRFGKSGKAPERFNNINKRFLRFGRGDPFLRFGKRSMDLDDMREGFLRIGRSLSHPSLLDLLETEGALSRKRRDVSNAPSEEEGLKRTTRGVSEGYLRFGRGGDSALSEGVALEGSAAAKRGDVANGDREYLRFGRGGQSNFPRWGKRYLRFGRGHSEGFLRFGKRS